MNLVSLQKGAKWNHRSQKEFQAEIIENSSCWKNTTVTWWQRSRSFSGGLQTLFNSYISLWYGLTPTLAHEPMKFEVRSVKMCHTSSSLLAWSSNLNVNRRGGGFHEAFCQIFFLTNLPIRCITCHKDFNITVYQISDKTFLLSIFQHHLLHKAQKTVFFWNIEVYIYIHNFKQSDFRWKYQSHL